ncbi:MAG TPA: ion transporter [Nitrososphaera sp.]|jgi:voltage-gated sodium channel|nr:ion transporter [Nitrososphaera sp.]
MEEKESSPSYLSGKSTRSTNSLVKFAQVVVANKTFDWVITSVILLQALVLALEATPELYSSGGEWEIVETELFFLTQNIVIGVFIVEAALRLTAHYPRPQSYFKDGWNCFDFAIIILSLLPVAGQFSTVARLVRLLRITRLITKSTELRAIVSTLIHSIPSIFNILILLSILFFIYAIVGYHLFRNVDPQHWSSFPISATTLFQIITLEGWVDVMEPIILNLGPIYWLYFASFILIGTFIVINLFISVIVRKSEEAYQQVQRESQIPLTQQEIMEEIREIHRILQEIEQRIGRDDKGNIQQE